MRLRLLFLQPFDYRGGRLCEETIISQLTIGGIKAFGQSRKFLGQALTLGCDIDLPLVLHEHVKASAGACRRTFQARPGPYAARAR